MKLVKRRHMFYFMYFMSQSQTVQLQSDTSQDLVNVTAVSASETEQERENAAASTLPYRYFGSCKCITTTGCCKSCSCPFQRNQHSSSFSGVPVIKIVDWIVCTVSAASNLEATIHPIKTVYWWKEIGGFCLKKTTTTRILSDTCWNCVVYELWKLLARSVELFWSAL